MDPVSVWGTETGGQRREGDGKRKAGEEALPDYNQEDRGLV